MVTYLWRQQNDSQPNKNAIGFWMSLNGTSASAKASSYRCEQQYGASYRNDTSGNRSYVCSATRNFSFKEFPALSQWAYNGNSLNAWDVKAGVALDDNGRWDSRDGKNYAFRF